MKRFLLLVTLGLTHFAFAQTTNTASKQNNGLHKFQFSIGYSHIRVDRFFGDGELYAEGNNDEHLQQPDAINLYGSPDLAANPQNVFPSRAIVNSGESHQPHLNGFNASVVYKHSKFIGIKFDVAGYFRSTNVNLSSVYTSAPYRSNMLLPLQDSYQSNTIRSLIIMGGGRYQSAQKHLSFLAGVEYTNNLSDKKVKPFGELLAGISVQSIQFKEFTQREKGVFGTDKFSNTGLSMAIGGGIDIRMSNRLKLRAIQIDYHPVQIKEQELVAFKQGLSNLGIPDNLTFNNISTATIYSNHEIRINSRWQHNFSFGVGVIYQ